MNPSTARATHGVEIHHAGGAGCLALGSSVGRRLNQIVWRAGEDVAESGEDMKREPLGNLADEAVDLGRRQLNAAFRQQRSEIEGGYQVPVEVQNVGDEAAANVKVSAELEAGAETRKAEETIDFLAPAEKTMVTCVFDHDPRKGHLFVSVSAFREP